MARQENGKYRKLLDITKAKYISYTINVKLYVEYFGLKETIKEVITLTTQDKVK